MSGDGEKYGLASGSELSEGEVNARVVQRRQKREAAARRSDGIARTRGRYVHLDEGPSSEGGFSFPDPNKFIPSDPWTDLDSRINTEYGLDRLFIKGEPRAGRKRKKEFLQDFPTWSVTQRRMIRRYGSIAAINARLDEEAAQQAAIPLNQADHLPQELPAAQDAAALPQAEGDGANIFLGLPEVEDIPDYDPDLFPFPDE